MSDTPVAPSPLPTTFPTGTHVSVPTAMRTAYQDDEEIDRPFTGKMHIMDDTGDSKIIWDSKNADEVASAKKQFDDLKKKGYVAYNVGKDGEKTTVMHEWDPDAERVVLSKPIRGG